MNTPPFRTSSGIVCWTAGTGPALVTVHGAPGTDHSFFRPYLDALSDDMQVVYFDLPGHGRSHAPEDHSLASMAMAIEDVRRAFDVEQVTLLGSSYGGFLSLLYALRHPASVASLILVDTSASYGFRQESLATAQQRGTPSMLRALDRLWDGSLDSDDAFHACWREVLPLYFHRLPRETIHQIADGSSYRLDTRKHILSTFQDYDVRHRLGEITAPSLVIAGRHDWITSVGQAEELAAGLPNSELVVFEESGHYPFIDERETFLQQVRTWLRARGVHPHHQTRKGRQEQ